MEYLTQLVTWLSDKTGVDQWVVAGALFMMVGLLGKTSVRGVIAWIAGEHKQIGEMAQGILALMDTLNNWQIGKVEGRIEGPGDVTIDTRNRDVYVDRTQINNLNRRERRLIFARARAVKDYLDERKQMQLHNEALNAIRQARA